MANVMIGKIAMIGDTVAIQSKDGSKSFDKRELRLDCTRYDIYTGEPRENFPQFEFSGSRCADLDRFKIGDFVQVSFLVTGVMYKNKITNKEKNFTKVQGYKVEYYNSDQSQERGYSTPIPSAQPIPAPQEHSDDLPF